MPESGRRLTTFGEGLDEARDVGDVVEEAELSVEEERGAARQVLLDLLHQRLQRLADLVCKTQQHVSIT